MHNPSHNCTGNRYVLRLFGFSDRNLHVRMVSWFWVLIVYLFLFILVYAIPSVWHSLPHVFPAACKACVLCCVLLYFLLSRALLPVLFCSVLFPVSVSLISCLFWLVPPSLLVCTCSVLFSLYRLLVACWVFCLLLTWPDLPAYLDYFCWIIGLSCVDYVSLILCYFCLDFVQLNKLQNLQPACLHLHLGPQLHFTCICTQPNPDSRDVDFYLPTTFENNVILMNILHIFKVDINLILP